MPPGILHYEQWIGPSRYHPYSPQYFGGVNGMNCLFWNMYRDFGVGQMGDMGAHTMDLVWSVVDAGAPSTVEVDQEVSDKFNPDITPVKLKVAFEHPANKWRGPITVVWYQGGLKPESPKDFIDVEKIAQRRHLRRHERNHCRGLHQPDDHSQQRRRGPHLLQAARPRTSFSR